MLVFRKVPFLKCGQLAVKISKLTSFSFTATDVRQVKL
jgi:hypothetical protein